MGVLTNKTHLDTCASFLNPYQIQNMDADSYLQMEQCMLQCSVFESKVEDLLTSQLGPQFVQPPHEMMDIRYLEPIADGCTVFSWPLPNITGMQLDYACSTLPGISITQE